MLALAVFAIFISGMICDGQKIEGEKPKNVITSKDHK